MTGASHSSVKRYRELARNPPKTDSNASCCSTVRTSCSRRANPDWRSRARRSSRTRSTDPSTKTLAEQLVADGADVFIVSRKTLESMSPVELLQAPSASRGARCRRLPPRSHRQTASSSSPTTFRIQATSAASCAPQKPQVRPRSSQPPRRPTRSGGRPSGDRWEARFDCRSHAGR